MKIELINRKHTKSCGEIAFRFDETINDEIIKRFNNRCKGIRLSKVHNEEFVFTIKVDKSNSLDRNLVVEKDIDFINQTLPEIKAEIEKEEADYKVSRQRILESASNNTGIPLDNSEE
jgi:hypothetical protein